MRRLITDEELSTYGRMSTEAAATYVDEGIEAARTALRVQYEKELKECDIKGLKRSCGNKALVTEMYNEVLSDMEQSHIKSLGK